MEVPRKLRITVTVKSSNYTSGYVPKENKKCNQKRYAHLYVHCIIIYSSKIWKQPKCSLTDEWMMIM